MLQSEAAFVQKKTGLRLFAWQAGLNTFDAEAIKGLVYLCKRRAGEQVDWDSLDFNLAGVEFIPDPDEVAEEPAPKEDGPLESETGT